MAMETSRSEYEQDIQSAYLILLAGGAVGASLSLAALMTSWWWWEPLVAWLRDGTREKLWQPLSALTGLLVGLGVMFAAFQAARKFERLDATLRRVLYGFNAFLMCFLLFLLLLVVNVFIHIRYPLPFDATEGGFYSLAEKTRQWVGTLEKPVEVYMLLPQDDPAYPNMNTLLTQMENLNPRYFHYEEVPVDGTNTSRIRDLAKNYKLFTPRPGLLVAYGDKPQENHSYISSSELSNFDFGGGPPQRSFNGEVRLMQELFFLSEGKKKPVVYFTQGNGEPELGDRSQEGLAELVQRLTQANYEVKALTAANPDPQKNSVPADAEIVVVAGPKRSMNLLVPALEKYMDPPDANTRKGKMVVLLGPTGPDRMQGNTMVETGMEGFLRRYGVNATKEQVQMMFDLEGRITVRGGKPMPENVAVGVLKSAAESRHPIAQIAKEERTNWVDVRRFDVLPNASPNYQVEPLMVTACYSWLEGDMSKSAFQTWQLLRTDQQEFAKRVNKEPKTVLAAVTESAPGSDPHSFSKPNQGRTPRLMVFGCSSLATNEYQRPRAGGIEFDLVRGSIDWCRERYSQIGVEPKSYRYFALTKPTSYWNLFYLPLAGMALTVFGMGLIVWNVRRR